MKKNARVSGTFRPGLGGEEKNRLLYPLLISFAGHLIFLILLVSAPGWKTEKQPLRSAIHVRMVSLKAPGAKTEKTTTVADKAPTVSKTKEAKPPAPTPNKEVKVATSVKPKPKTSLKKKTFKSDQVIKHALTQLKEKDRVETKKTEPSDSPESLKSALERLKKEVHEAESERSHASGTATDSGKTSGKLSGQFSESGKKVAEKIDLYRIEIAFQIQKHWAFNEQLAGNDRSLVAAIVFKVMPDGEIRDVFFTDRSGNRYLDDSAYNAIMKSNPVDPHPSGLKLPYVEMGVRFTPQGIR